MRIVLARWILAAAALITRWLFEPCLSDAYDAEQSLLLDKAIDIEDHIRERTA